MNTPRSMAIVVATSFSLLALGGCGGGAAPTATVTDAAPAVSVPAVTVTATQTEEPTEEPVVEEATPAPEAPEKFKMPKLVGKNLQLAQDTLQSQGSYVLDQKDALGLDRFQIDDSNWRVCKQSPKAGKTVVIETMVTLSAVKLSEDCP